MSKSTTPAGVLHALVDDLLHLTLDGLTEEQGYARHPEGAHAVIVDTYDEEGEIDGRYTVTFNIENKES